MHGRTDGQTMANSIVPLPHRVRAGDKNVTFVGPKCSIFLGDFDPIEVNSSIEGHDWGQQSNFGAS